MKVLITTIFAYPPRGGVGKYIQELTKGLERAGHKVDILARHEDEYRMTRSNRQISLKRKKPGGGRVPFLPLNWGTGNKVQNYLKNLRDEMVKFFDAVQSIDLSQYQIIHAQDIASAAVLRAYKPRRTPLILTVHGCVTAEYYYFGYIRANSPESLVLSSFESEVVESTDQTIVPSNWLVRIYEKCRIPTGNMKVISNGIDIASFRKQMKNKTSMTKPKNKSVIISTGRLEKVKGQHCLLDALARLRRDRKDWVCWIVGRGDAGSDLRKKAKRLGLSGYVKFLGRRNNIPALLNQADIFVIPSLQDNYPYTLVEAQVAGKPIIASDVGGITEMVEHGKNGLLVPPGNGTKLYWHLKKLLADRKLQQRLGEEAKRWGRTNLSLEKMTKQVLEVYNKALKPSSTDRSKN
ncbi:glycosyltransferase family 4 protein [Cohnella cholangitidis]|uniref:Glycosyltransferase family 4 protein n=1 Tax=Cohnella cholangitidis TaxID=2598458 RepID=A0A7G5BV08_9BACL|nr:glycosyltransferase family 4 protein [Cohnella cholangitidis]QMV40792.1 glycosyltransferase family 4 protein [Cohnella cholangitidis]